MTSAEVNGRLASRIGPLERSICAVWLLREQDPEKRAIGLKTLVPERGPVADALRDLVTEGQLERAAVRPPSILLRDLVGRLVPLLGHRDRSARVSAAALLGLLGSADAVPPLSERVSDPEPDVRREAITALGEIGDPAGLAALIRTAHGRDPFTGFDAVNAVTKIGGQGAHQALLDILADHKLDRAVRTTAADELRVSGDPVAEKAAKRYLAGTRPQWKPAILFAPFLYLLAFMASWVQPPSRRMLWVWALYLAASGSIVFLINPAWFLTGREMSTFWSLAVLYPLGVAAGGVPVVAWLRLRGHEETATLIGERIKRCVLLMWGTLAAWVAVFFGLMLIGLRLAWR